MVVHANGWSRFRGDTSSERLHDLDGPDRFSFKSQLVVMKAFTEGKNESPILSMSHL